MPALSPDGRRVAFAVDWEVRRDEPADSEPRYAIYVATRNGSRIRRISPIYEGAGWGWPTWSADGRMIAFHANSTRAGSERGIAFARPDGDGYRLLRRGLDARYLKFAPVGRRLLFLDWGDSEPPRVTTWNLRTNKLRTISAAELGSGFTWNVTWTPDGRRIAYSHQAWTPSEGIVWGAPMELFTIRPDGTRVRRLVQLPGSYGDALTWRAP
jgi:Tol biopolymer transport system component